MFLASTPPSNFLDFCLNEKLISEHSSAFNVSSFLVITMLKKASPFRFETRPEETSSSFSFSFNSKSDFSSYLPSIKMNFSVPSFETHASDVTFDLDSANSADY